MINDYLQQLGQLLLPSGANAYGETQFAAPATVACRVQHATRRVVTETGKELISETQVFLKPDQAVAPGAKFTFDGRTWTVGAVRVRQDFLGPAFKVAYLGG